MSKNISEVLLEVLANAGVEYIFSIPGAGINEVVEAIRTQDKIKIIHVRHEEAGAFAASAYAKLTGKLAACMGTSGPGAIHLLNGLYDAKHDHAPVIAISGQVETQYLGTETHQEVNLHLLFESVSVYNQIIRSADQMPQIVETACRMALHNRGVSHLILSSNIASKEVSQPELRTNFLYEKPTISPSEEALQKAAELLNKSEKVTILAGIGAQNAATELLQIAEILKAPIIKALRGKDILPDEHPYCVGGLGLLGTKPAVKAINKCDCFIMVGTDFSYTEFYPENTPAIQIDIDGTQIGKRYSVEVGLEGDAAETLSLLVQYLTPKENSSFLADIQRDMKDWWKMMDKDEKSDEVPVRPQAVAAAISFVANDDAIFCCDTGAVTVWGARNLRIRGKQKFTLSGGLASMAYGLPASIAAKLAFPNRQVIALVGDGGFAMLMGDFLTAVQYKLPIVVVVFNNHKLGLIQMEQEVMGYPEFQTELHNPNFAAFAEACGGLGERITTSEQLIPSITRALASGQPYILDVEINPEQLTMPPKIEINQALNYARAKVREFFGQDN
jgi:pyruvate oxidase